MGTGGTLRRFPFLNIAQMPNGSAVGAHFGSQLGRQCRCDGLSGAHGKVGHQFLDIPLAQRALHLGIIFLHHFIETIRTRFALIFKLWHDYSPLYEPPTFVLLDCSMSI